MRTMRTCGARPLTLTASEPFRCQGSAPSSQQPCRTQASAFARFTRNCRTSIIKPHRLCNNRSRTFSYRSQTAMDTLEFEPQVLAGRGVSFSLPCPQGPVECMVTIKTLQDCFWLEPKADDI